MTIKTFGELASILEEMMKTHDWYYAYSDDHRVWEKGKAEEEKIQLVLKRMRMMDASKALTIYTKFQKKYSPPKGG